MEVTLENWLVPKMEVQKELEWEWFLLLNLDLLSVVRLVGKMDDSLVVQQADTKVDMQVGTTVDKLVDQKDVEMVDSWVELKAHARVSMTAALLAVSQVDQKAGKSVASTGI